MRTSNLTLVALSILSCGSFAQDYQTIKSNSIPFFIATDGDYFLASRIDQVESIGTDSTFYPFQTIREDEFLEDTDPCKYYLGASWMGEKINIKPDGSNVFYNKDGETITIQTQAALNDTFNVYNYQNGDWINGTISSLLEISIFGTMDTIKVIDLFSNVPINLTNPRFVISKNHGIVELFAPYSFPEAYQGSTAIDNESHFPIDHNKNFCLVGLNNDGFSKPTLGDINDFSIGDLRQFLSIEEVSGETYSEEFNEIEIHNKFIWGTDSVVYFISNNGYQKTIDIQTQNTVITNYPGDIESISITQLDQWQNDFLPEEFNGVDGWTSLFINDCGDVEERMNTESISWVGFGSCLSTTETPFGHSSYIAGVGVIGANETNPNSDSYKLSEMVFYERTNGEDCGSREFLSSSEIETSQNFHIFPNPASNAFAIQLNEAADIKIHDLSGKVVYSKEDCVGTQQLSLNLETGVYIVQIGNQVGRSVQKLEVSR